MSVDKQLQDFMWGKNSNKGITTGLDSQATQKPQPSKQMNAGSVSIPWADPNVPSKNNATRRAEYGIQTNFENYMNWLSTDQKTKLREGVQTLRSQGKNEAEINSYLNQLAQGMTPQQPENKVGNVNPTGSFATYQSNYTYGKDSVMDEQMAIYDKANTKNETALAGLLLETDALKAKSSNVNDVRNLINEITQAYRKGIYDTNTIAKQLWVDPNYVKLVQQGKAAELVHLSDDFRNKMMKGYDWQREDYDISQKRLEEDYNLSMRRLESQYSSAMQRLHRDMFDSQWASNVGSAVAGLSGSQYAYDSLKAKHEQAINDMKNEYNFANEATKMALNRATQDYAKNIERLDFQYAEGMKEIQASVLAQFQQIDSKIWLTVEQMANSYWSLLQNVATAKNKIVWDYIKALWAGQEEYARQISNLWGLWLDPNSHNFTDKDLWRTWSAVKQKDWTTKRVSNINIPNATNNFGNIIYKAWANEVWRVGSYTSQNGRTYNVYWSRADGYNAAKALLKRAYYGMKINDAIGKWINWSWSAPKRAAEIAQSNGLSLSEVLSDSNADKLLLSMGQWEWSLRSGQTIEQWIAEGEDYSRYASKSWSAWETDWLTPDQIAGWYAIIKDLYWTKAVNDKTPASVAARKSIFDQLRAGKTLDDIEDSIKKWRLDASLTGKPWYSNAKDAVAINMNKNQKEQFFYTVEEYAKQGKNDLVVETILQNSLKDADKKKMALMLNEASINFNSIKKWLEALEKEGVDLSLMKGSYEDVLKKLGTSGNQKVRAIATEMQKVFESYKNMISGTAVSDKEAVELKKWLTSISNDFPTNYAVIEGNERYIDNRYKTLYQTAVGNAQYRDLLDEYTKQTGNQYDHRQSVLWGNVKTVMDRQSLQGIVDAGKTVLKMFWLDVDKKTIPTKVELTTDPFISSPWRNIDPALTQNNNTYQRKWS